jgi:uncharacterized protein (TIGR02996 family)
LDRPEWEEMGAVVPPRDPREETIRQFVANIREDPGDDTRRLVFADWLRENGDEGRADFIAAQIELTISNVSEADRLRAAPALSIQEYYGRTKTIRDLIRKWLDANSKHIRAEIPVPVHPRFGLAKWSRGFIETISMDWSQLASAVKGWPEIVGHPFAVIRRMEVTTYPDVKSRWGRPIGANGLEVWSDDLPLGRAGLVHVHPEHEGEGYADMLTRGTRKLLGRFFPSNLGTEKRPIPIEWRLPGDE